MNTFSECTRSDGQTLASLGEKTIKLWDVTTGKERGTLKGHTDLITSVAFSPDGMTLASGSWDKRVKLWDLATGKERASLDGHTDRVRSLAISMDGMTLASGSDTTIKLWDVTTAKERDTFPTRRQPDYVRRLTFSPDGKTLTYATLSDPIPTLLDVCTGEERRIERPQWVGLKDEPTIGRILFSRDGMKLLTVIDDTIGVWDVTSGKHTAGYRGIHRSRYQSIHRFLDRLGLPLPGTQDYVSSLLFTQDGKLVALGMRDKTVLIWNVATFPHEKK